jgi:hypothetical protein
MIIVTGFPWTVKIVGYSLAIGSAKAWIEMGRHSVRGRRRQKRELEPAPDLWVEPVPGVMQLAQPYFGDWEGGDAFKRLPWGLASLLTELLKKGNGAGGDDGTPAPSSMEATMKSEADSTTIPTSGQAQHIRLHHGGDVVSSSFAAFFVVFVLVYQCRGRRAAWSTRGPGGAPVTPAAASTAGRDRQPRCGLALEPPVAGPAGRRGT